MQCDIFCSCLGSSWKLLCEASWVGQGSGNIGSCCSHKLTRSREEGFSDQRVQQHIPYFIPRVILSAKSLCPFLFREQFRFLLSPPASGLHAHFTEQLKWTSLEPRSSQSSEDQNTEPLVFSSTPSPSSSSDSHPHQPGVLSESQVFLPGAGLAKKLYKERYLVGTFWWRTLWIKNNVMLIKKFQCTKSLWRERIIWIICLSQSVHYSEVLSRKRCNNDCMMTFSVITPSPSPSNSGLLGISLVLIVGFCVQGDNIQDAVSMAGWLDSWIHISKEVRKLASWVCLIIVDTLGPEIWQNVGFCRIMQVLVRGGHSPGLGVWCMADQVPQPYFKNIDQWMPSTETLLLQLIINIIR